MNKIISVTKDVLPLAALLLAFALIFIPVPVMAIQVLIALNVGIALCLFAAGLIKKVKFSMLYSHSALFYAVFGFEVAIAAIRPLLTARTIEEQIPLARIIGQWICRENYVCGFFTMFVACAGILFIFRRGVVRISEVAARFSLDISAQRTFAIDQQLAKNMITNEEAKNLRKKLCDEIEVYSVRDGTAKILGKALCALFVLFSIVVAGGVALGILVLKMTWQAALEQYITLACGYLALFVVPLFLVGIGFSEFGTEWI